LVGDPKRFEFKGYQIDIDGAKNLWNSFKGKTKEEKLTDCLSFAKNLGLSARNFCGKVFLMVFNEFPGYILSEVEDIEKGRAFKLFHEFVNDFCEQQIKSPLPEKFYEQTFYMTYNDFIMRLKNLLDIAQDENELVIGLNSICPDFGQFLFSRWLERQRKIPGVEDLVKKAQLLKTRLVNYINGG
jgi:hypothetical protein